ncbi:MAG: hypothetical protein QOD33_1884 [Pyrinomonadaceae bacterium]|nr:hypothetical protein [Pyrinomonadaceae bacterium]
MPEPTSSQSPANPSRARAAFLKLELPGDALLFLYFAVLAREYFWWVTNNNYAAWTASVVLAACALWLYLTAKDPTEENEAGLPFWLIGVLPLVFIYTLRVAFPDVSFDVLNYRLLHAERGLRGFLYLPGEFFPTPAPYNPAPDMVTGIFRHALGYRLGTIVNLLALIWTARIADKLLRPFWRNAWVRATGVLLVVMAEHLLFEINNYMVDLLAVPLLLAATHLTLQLGAREDTASAGARDLNEGPGSTQRRRVITVALLLGMSVAFKLTNAGIALPLVLLCAYRVLFDDGKPAAKQLAWTTVLCAAAFLLPLAPFSVYLYRTTGSAVFPIFNGVFKSAYWPLSNTWDPRWGGVGYAQKLAWPILITFKPERLSELAVYSGRISFGFVAAFAGLIFCRRDARLRALCFIVVLGAMLWSASTGYIRYAFYLEVLAAIVVLALASRLWANAPRSRSRITAVALLWLGLLLQACFAGYYVSQNEWGGRPTIFTQPGPFKTEAHLLLRDRSLRRFLNADTREKFDAVEVWIVSSMKTASVEALLQPAAPMIGINTGEYFLAPAARTEFDEALARVSGKRIFTLAFPEDLTAALATLRSHGLSARESVPVEIPFFAPQGKIKMFLIAVGPAQSNPVAKDTSVSNTPHDPAYRAEISATAQPALLVAGAKLVLNLKVRNQGETTWRARVPAGWMGVVTVGDRWLRADGVGVVNEQDSRSALPHDLQPGEEADLMLSITAPPVAGDYVLEIDMVHEGVTWFYQRGSPTLRWPVRVEQAAK